MARDGRAQLTMTGPTRPENGRSRYGKVRLYIPRNAAMIALKLTLVPAFLLVVSMSEKWWGPTIAGWLAGLPVVAGPILFLLVLEHGSAFGARAATLSLSVAAGRKTTQSADFH